MDFPNHQQPNTSKTILQQQTPVPTFQISGEVTSLEQSSTLLLKQLADGIKLSNEKADNINGQQILLGSKVDRLVTSNNERLENIECDNNEIQKRMDFLEQENELLHREVKFQNLILLGLTEKRYENSEGLKQDILELIFRICKKRIPVDTVYKLGAYREQYKRPVRIRFLSHSDRNLVYEKRMLLPEGAALKEDLPFSLRRDHNLIRRKRDELTEEQVSFKINWKTKTIYADNGIIFYVINGQLHQEFTTVHESTNEQLSFDENAFLNHANETIHARNSGNKNAMDTSGSPPDTAHQNTSSTSVQPSSANTPNDIDPNFPNLPHQTSTPRQVPPTKYASTNARKIPHPSRSIIQKDNLISE
ncbi:unnamed protein product [Orchesella dallaii]|uniref:Uncharacterized protein n=1 Tax=Orchesella dallaii TaxID=48710 RepID=A0ABP1RX22_9HEXA